MSNGTISISDLNISLPANTLQVGATMAYPNEKPTFMEKHPRLRLRDQSNNDFLGYTLTRPSENKFVYGLGYYDRNEGSDNEDFFELDTNKATIKKYYGKKWEKRHRKYLNSHKGDKSYLRHNKK